MPEESKESKAKKLAAARKKLKEYQQRGTATTNTTNNTVSSTFNYAESSNNSGHVSSNISERSESELQLNGSVNDVHHEDNLQDIEQSASQVFKTEPNLETQNVNYFAMEQAVETVKDVEDNNIKQTSEFKESSESSHNINAIQVLITEKSQLTMELNKCRTLCREKDLEMEELRVQHNNAAKRVEDLTQRLVDIQKQQEQQRLHNAELQHKLAQSRAEQEDHSAHIQELKQQLTLRDERLKQLESEFKDKCNELELSQLRIRQLSDENNISKDNRVETLTQTQFMYEQQIRDLQAMVQQLTQDKEQANTQYQTYVQQLNAQVQQLTERNNELLDDVAKLQEREKQCVEHIQQMEKEIQKNISRQAEVKEEKEKESSSITAATNDQLQALQERINEFDSERYEFQLKIKSQEDRLNSLQLELKQKDAELEQLKDHLENITSEQPDKTKLLATMESDKVAASRALTQNVELKKQLDELELRFVQLTNDKADLMTRLDSEQYTNREMHTNYAAMEERLRTIDERFKFKDEEMIRLSHENEELKKKLENLKSHRHDETEDGDEHDHHDDHEHHGDHHRNHEHNHEHDHHDLKHEHNHEHDHHDHKHDHHDHKHNHHDHHDHKHDHHDHKHDHHDHKHDHNDHKHDHHDHKHDHHDHKHDHNDHKHDHHDHKHDHHDHKHDHDHNMTECQHSDDQESCKEATEENTAHSIATQTPVSHKTQTKHTNANNTTPHIASEEAVEKLQQRFTQLMTQCADLTEEKQRLEHLVMQLQSETETIGEYIALYQTQRRILKQREYEKAAQTALLQAEREQMRERLNILNNLVNSLGMELPQNQELRQQINEALAAQNAVVANSLEQTNSPLNENVKNPTTPSNEAVYQTPPLKDLNSPESQQILHKIQDIITEIKENTKELPTIQHTVDHLNCCSGKFEVV